MVNINEKQSAINKIIVDFSEKSYQPLIIEKILSETLLSIYDENFRHSYSLIFAVIQKRILNHDNRSIEFLSSNIETLHELVHDHKIIEKYSIKHYAISKIEKLYDHVMLEVARIGYLNTLNSKQKDFDAELKETKSSVHKLLEETKKEIDLKSQETIKSVSGLIDSTTKELNDKTKETIDNVNSSLKNADNQINSLRTESITVLSILAAVMLGGIGGFASLGQFFGKIDSVSIYKFFASASFVGVILFNVIFMLIYMVARLTGRSIYTICDDECACRGSDEGHCYNGPCGTIRRIRKRIPYVFWFNLISAIVILFSLTIEYLVMKYAFADWLLILFAFLFIGLSVYYGIKNSKV